MNNVDFLRKKGAPWKTRLDRCFFRETDSTHSGPRNRKRSNLAIILLNKMLSIVTFLRAQCAQNSPQNIFTAYHFRVRPLESQKRAGSKGQVLEIRVSKNWLCRLVFSLEIALNSYWMTRFMSLLLEFNWFVIVIAIYHCFRATWRT